MSLTKTQKQFLRGLSHKLSPIIQVGNAGLSEAVLAELELALSHHELLKIRFQVADRDDKKAMTQQVVAQTNSELIHQIGHIISIYRHNPKKPKIQLPK